MKGQSSLSVYHLGLTITVAGMIGLGALSVEALLRLIKKAAL